MRSSVCLICKRISTRQKNSGQTFKLLDNFLLCFISMFIIQNWCKINHDSIYLVVYFRYFTFFCVILFLLQCYILGVENTEHLSGEELHTPDSFLVIFNGSIIGKHRRPQVWVFLLSYFFLYLYLIQICIYNYISFIVNLNILLFKKRFATAMRKLRRACLIGEFVSVYVNEKQVSYFAVDSFSLFFLTVSYFIPFSCFLVQSFFLVGEFSYLAFVSYLKIW